MNFWRHAFEERKKKIASGVTYWTLAHQHNFMKQFVVFYKVVDFLFY